MRFGRAKGQVQTETNAVPGIETNEAMGDAYAEHLTPKEQSTRRTFLPERPDWVSPISIQNTIDLQLRTWVPDGLFDIPRFQFGLVALEARWEAVGRIGK